MESGNANFTKNGILKTEGSKYSSILNENPTRSTAFTNPRKDENNGNNET